MEKAAEMGAARIMPVRTEFTVAERIRRDRLQVHAIEAAKQCGETSVARVDEMSALARILETWPADRKLMFCDEMFAGKGATLSGPSGPWAILIGPEGGFSEAERRMIGAMPQVVSVSLGPRVLRADTAAVAAMTLWQSSLGDWT